MKLLLPVLTLLTTSASAGNPCPLLGPSWPTPTNLSSNTAVNSALRNITTNIQNAVNAGNFSNASLALQIFEKSETVPLLNLSYTGQPIDTNVGVSKVDQNTVFRIGSTSKVFTALLLLIRDQFDTFNHQISRFIPEIWQAELKHVRNGTERNDGVNFIKWNEVTVGELASHLAGLARDYGALDMAEQAPLLQSLGFPVISSDETPPCGSPNPCTREQFFNGLLKTRPVVAASTTPIYSNAAFQILGYVVELLSNMSYGDTLQKEIIDPLGLKNTFYDPPNTSLGVIPVPQGEYWWNFAFGDEGPAGGIFSSANDLSMVGRAILNSTLVPPVTTRRWLKPQTHTSSLDYGVGAPWEIISFGDERPIDLYTKSGDVGLYSSAVVLDPDHDVGFAILAAGNGTHESIAMISDIISTTLLPALEQAAKSQADASFSGTYNKPDTNSSITIATDAGPALVVTSWFNNGSDMLKSYATLTGFPDPSQMSIRLYPTGLTSPGQIAFRAVMPPPFPPGIGPFTSSCITWVTVDSHVYGNIGLDEFVFDVDGNGTAYSISPRALRTSLTKTSVGP